MTYATAADMVARFGARELVQLTDPAAQQLDEGRIATALQDAHMLIDGLIGRAYVLPLAGCATDASGERMPPPQLVRIACDIARYYLYDDLAPQSEVAARHKQALAELEAIASGQALLSCPLGDAPGRLLSDNKGVEAEVLYHFAPRQMDAAGGYR